ncbi:MAG: hypothetical protein ABR611_02415 [Chthoniobacterales bacterium]
MDLETGPLETNRYTSTLCYVFPLESQQLTWNNSLGMTFVRYFISIVAGALVSSALGGIFACIVAWISPEFVGELFSHGAPGSLVRYAAGVGMIWGLFLGTAVMGFSLLLVTLIQIARVIRRKNDEQTVA